MAFLKKLLESRTWKRIFYERLTEPLHLNALSIPIALFGSHRQKTEFDLVLRAHNAFSILKAADEAKSKGLSKMTIVEFGVAAGTGLLNMCVIAEKVSSITGVKITVIGFDTGKGMPPARDYRDHPEFYAEGDFPSDVQTLRRMLHSNAELILGELSETVPEFLRTRMSPESPIGFVVVDVDYYSSTKDALELLKGDPGFYLPITILYADDVHFDGHNPYAGELLAISEFNHENNFRKICRPEFLENQRIFRRANWIKHIFYIHIMDHPDRKTISKGGQQILPNLYVK
jgi:hypothetical protein